RRGAETWGAGCALALALALALAIALFLSALSPRSSLGGREAGGKAGGREAVRSRGAMPPRREGVLWLSGSGMALLRAG
ncbi:unnamed protein product, partial [Bubo scandiacus]